MATQSSVHRDNLNSKHQVRRYILRKMLLWWPPLMLLLLAALTYVYYQRIEVDNVRLRNANRVALHNSAQAIQYRLNWILKDLNFLIDLTNHSIAKPAKLTSLFSALIQNRLGIYDQIRLLDQQGKERIRINEVNGQAQVVPDDQLQDKSGSYYYQQSQTLTQRQVLMSRFDLNIERGQVEMPQKPVIRFIARVYDKQTETIGFIVLNYLGHDLFMRIHKNLPDYTETLNQLWMVNDEGYWLQGPDPEQAWGFMFTDKQNQTIAQDFPKIWAVIQSKPKQGQLLVEGGLLSYTSLHVDGLFKLKENMVYSNPNERWFLLDYIPKKQLVQRRQGLLDDLLLAFLMIAVISSLLLWLLLRSMGGRWLVNQREKLYIDIMERIPTGIFVLDGQGRPCLMNQMASAIVGDKLSGDFNLDDLPRRCEIYREGSDLLYPFEDLPIVQALQGNTVTAYDMEIRREDSRIPIQVTAAPILDEHGNITHAVAAFSDISQLKQQQARIREEETLHKALFDSSIDAIITIDANAEIIRINPAAEKMFGYRREELLGNNVNLLVPEPYHSCHDQYLRNYLETGQGKIIGIGREVEVRCKDGRLIPCDLAITEVKLPGKHLFKGILRDIRERKQIEQMQKEFIATVSHELRTPLTSISGSLKLLAHELEDDVQPLTKELLEIAGDNAERLILLVNDILDIEKLESGAMKFDMKLHQLQNLVDQAVTANQSYAEQHATRFKIIENATNADVIVDKDRFIQVLTNLLSNAAKFSPAGCPVEVFSDQFEDTIRVTVADQGPGIPESFKEQLFNKFAQAEHADSQKKGGTGLGLCIAKVMIERMGGQIGYESEPGQGSRFYIELPVYDEAGSRLAKDAPESTERKVSYVPRILICEDDKDVARLLKIMLEKNSFQADIAFNWAQAKKMLQSYVYAAMTLDLRLPDMHWAVVFEQLRQNDKTRHLPVIVVSAIANEAKFDINVSAINIFDWLSKPIDEQRLVRAVTESLNQPIQVEQLPNILYLDDDQAQAQKILSLLQGHANVVVAYSVEQANHYLLDMSFNLIIINMNLPDIPELLLQPELDNNLPPTPVMIVSGGNNEQKILFEVQQISSRSQYNDEALVATIERLIRSNT